MDISSFLFHDKVTELHSFRRLSYSLISVSVGYLHRSLLRAPSALLQSTFGKSTLSAGCPVPIFSYFLSLFLFSPIFKLKPPIFRIFLAGETKICNKIENGIIVVCVFE